MIKITNSESLIRLFQHPLCSKQSLIQRALTIFFHIFTLFIPLTTYKVISCIIPKKEYVCCIKPQALNSVQSEALRKKVLAQADHMLENSNVPALAYDCSDDKQPKNDKICYLMGLSKATADQLWHCLTKAQKYKENECSIEGLMRINYAISVLALKEISKSDKVKELKDTDSHLDVNFFYFSEFYHRIRGQAPEEYVARFYQKGTLQNKWRLMYNDYCDQVHRLISRKELRKAGLNHHAAWTQPDLSPDTFQTVPSTLPETYFTASDFRPIDLPRYASIP